MPKKRKTAPKPKKEKINVKLLMSAWHAQERCNWRKRQEAPGHEY
ncbi:MAG: hypothetical protein WCT19_03850 [Candidatus Paceibacterota bacterium]